MMGHGAERQSAILRRRILALCVCGLWGAVGTGRLSGQTSTDEKFLAGLQERRLYGLAASYCRERLANSQLAAREQAMLVAQLVRIYGQRALETAFEERGAWWQQAHEAAEAFGRNHADQPFLALVRVQDALVLLAEGELLRQESDALRVGQEERRHAAVTALRAAVQALERLDRELEQAIPLATTTAGEQAPSADELFALRNHVRLELARALRNRGLCYPEGDDRVAAITQALDVLKAALTQLPAEDELAWRGRIEQCTCYRLLGSQSEAHRVLATLDFDRMPVPLRAAARAEAVRVELAAQPLDRSLALATQDIPTSGELADLDLARLEVFVALWRRATAARDDAASTEWRTKAVALTRHIEQNYGMYWGRRAEQLVLNSAQGGQESGDVEILRRKADDLYLQGKLAEAVAAYDQAATTAGRLQLAGDQFLCRARAALVEQERKVPAAALDRWHQLALSLPEHPQASGAHWEAIKLAIELARNQPDWLPRYEELLVEHLRRWPDGATNDTARLWLALLRRQQQAWDEAIQLYATIGPDSPAAAPAIDGALAAWRGKISRSAPAAPEQTLVNQAILFFQERVTDTGLAADRARLAAAQIVLEYAPLRAAEAAEWLQPLMSHEQGDEQSRREARELWLIALALQPERHQEALEQFRQLPAAQVAAVVGTLGQRAAVLTTGQRVEIARLQTRILAQLSWDALDDTTRAKLERARAQSLVLAGEREEAIRAYGTLAAAQPRDGPLQLEYARALESGNTPEYWRRARDQWSLVAGHTKPRTAEWYEAKCGVARAMCQLGQRAEAAKLIRYLLLTSPPPASSPWHRTLGELLAQAEQ